MSAFSIALSNALTTLLSPIEYTLTLILAHEPWLKGNPILHALVWLLIVGGFLALVLGCGEPEEGGLMQRMEKSNARNNAMVAMGRGMNVKWGDEVVWEEEGEEDDEGNGRW